MGDRTHAAQWYQRQARGCATELSYHYKLQGNDVAVSASDDSQAPVNIGADCGYRPRLRSDRPVFKAPPTPPPPDAAAATFAIRPDYKPHTRRASMEIVIPYAPRALQAQLHAEMQARRWGVVVCHSGMMGLCGFLITQM